MMEITISNYAEYLKSRWQHGEERLFHAIRQIININNTEIYYYDIVQNQDEIILIAISSDILSAGFGQSVIKYMDELLGNINCILKMDAVYSVGEQYNDFFSFVQQYNKVVTENGVKINVNVTMGVHKSELARRMDCNRRTTESLGKGYALGNLRLCNCIRLYRQA